MKRKQVNNDNGFEEHGGYMAAKIQKLEDQFNELQRQMQKTNLFEGKLMARNCEITINLFNLRRINIC